MPIRDYALLGPELYLVALAVAVLLADMYAPPRLRNLPPALAAVGLVGGLIPLFWIWGPEPRTEMMGALIVSNFALFIKGICMLVGALVVLISTDFLRVLRQGYGEFYSLLVFMVLGMCVLASANDLVLLYVAFELLSFCSYLLAAYLRHDRASNEAGLKYFLYGVAASAVMLYGLTLLYGLSGTTNISGLREQLLGAGAAPGALAPIALVLVAVGLGYKVTMAPFHAWAPDVYEGAPTPVTALLSVGPKAAGFAILARVMWQLAPALMPAWPMVLALLATATMFTGNLLAIRQTNIKRMLAYSSIAHAGYLLIAVVVGPHQLWAAQGLLFYFGAYMLMNIGAFSIVILVERNRGDAGIAGYHGLARSEPVIALAMFIFLLSLTGIPGTAGFIGKFLIFGAAISSQTWYWLAIIGIVNSAVSLFYYMNVVRVMYFPRASGEALAARPAGVLTVIYTTLVGTLLLGIAPLWLLYLGEQAGRVVARF